MARRAAERGAGASKAARRRRTTDRRAGQETRRRGLKRKAPPCYRRGECGVGSGGGKPRLWGDPNLAVFTRVGGGESHSATVFPAARVDFDDVSGVAPHLAPCGRQDVHATGPDEDRLTGRRSPRLDRFEMRVWKRHGRSHRATCAGMTSLVEPGSFSHRSGRRRAGGEGNGAGPLQGQNARSWSIRIMYIMELRDECK